MYIVYQTTNKVNNYIYIGVHKTDRPYEFDGYLGNGISIYKPRTYENAKTKMQQAVKEYGKKNFVRETIAVFETAEEAYFLESILVDEEFLARPDVYNMIVGGEMWQYRQTVTYKYTMDGQYVEEFPTIKEAAQKVGVRPNTLCQAILYHRSCKGFYWTSVKTEVLDTSIFNVPCIYKVYIYNLDGSFYKEFESCHQASKEIGVGGVERAARLGYLLNQQYYACFVKANSYSIARDIYIKTRPVYKYAEDGSFLEEYETQAEAEHKNKKVNIARAIKNKSSDINGNYWSLEKLPRFIKKEAKKKVGMFDDNGNLLKQWDSGRQCSLEYGKGVYHCLKGEYPKHKGYVFKYIN